MDQLYLFAVALVGGAIVSVILYSTQQAAKAIWQWLHHPKGE